MKECIIVRVKLDGRIDSEIVDHRVIYEKNGKKFARVHFNLRPVYVEKGQLYVDVDNWSVKGSMSGAEFFQRMKEGRL